MGAHNMALGVQHFPTGTTTLTYASDGDANGVFYFLGALAAPAWANPHTDKRIVIACSSLGTGSLAGAVDRAANDNYANPAAGNWWSVDLGANRSLIVTKWSFRQRSAGGYLQTAAKFQCSDDNTNWTDKDTQTYANQTSNDWNSYTITGETIGYRYWRLLRNGADTSGSTYFTFGEWELYGTLRY